jgi:hypothetical protein
MLKQPETGSRFVVGEFHPYFAGMHGFIVGPLDAEDMVVKIDPNSIYEDGIETIIGRCWLEEESHEQH